jgi:beta-lactamase class A
MPVPGAKFLVLLVLLWPGPAQATDVINDRLRQQLEPMIANLSAEGVRASVGVQQLNDAQADFVLIGSHEPYHPASVIKLLLITTLLQQADAELLSLDRVVTVTPEAVVGGMGTLQHDRLPQQLTLDQLAELTVTISDNTATNVLVDVVGYEAMAALAERLGLQQTRFGRKMFETPQPPLRDNTTTAADTLRLLSVVYHGDLLLPASRGHLLRWMGAQTVRTKIAVGIPPGIPLAHKTGENGPVSHDVGYVLSPAGEFALVIFSETSRTSDFDAAQALLNPIVAELAAAVYTVLNP